jgi:hypothetical protein
MNGPRRHAGDFGHRFCLSLQAVSDFNRSGLNLAFATAVHINDNVLSTTSTIPVVYEMCHGHQSRQRLRSLPVFEWPIQEMLKNHLYTSQFSAADPFRPTASTSSLRFALARRMHIGVQLTFSQPPSVAIRLFLSV